MMMRQEVNEEFPSRLMSISLILFCDHLRVLTPSPTYCFALFLFVFWMYTVTSLNVNL